MNVGMLWFDNDNKSDLPAKVKRAASYYQSKYGKWPNLCFVHPTMAPAETQPAPGSSATPQPVVKAGEVEIRTTRSVLPNHLWIGINGAPANGNGHNSGNGAGLLRPAA